MSMIEVERKRELADQAEVKARLVATGYHETGTRVEVDTYYTRPDRDFLTTVECLRVRQRDGFAEITYKPASTAATHSAGDIIAKRETNVVLAGPEQAAGANLLLDTLGMVRLCQVDKTRTTYRHPEQETVTVVIDVIAGLGAFAETEVLARDATDAAELLEQVERQFGLDTLPVARLPYRDLVLQREKGTALPCG